MPLLSDAALQVFRKLGARIWPGLNLTLLWAATWLAAFHAHATIEFVDSGQSLGFGLSYGADLGDVDGDGDLDIAVAGLDGRSLLWFNQGGIQKGEEGTFEEIPYQITWDLTMSHDVRLVDLDGDADLDVFLVNKVELDHHPVWLNQGAVPGGTVLLLESGQVIGDLLVQAVAFGQLDEVPGPDAFWVRRRGGEDQVWLNDGSGTFSDSGQRLGTDDGRDVALGDVDGDGDLDAFVANDGGNVLWINQGGAQGGNAGAFVDSGQWLSTATSVALGDLDGDGDLDAFVGRLDEDYVWINQGGGQGGIEGEFDRRSQSFGSKRTHDVALGDLDGDGDLDALVIGSDDPIVYENEGDGHFIPAAGSINSCCVEAVVLGDLDGDGDLDAFLARSGQPDQVWLNQSATAPVQVPSYTITTIAGEGDGSTLGEGGPALESFLDRVADVAVDGRGNVFIAASERNRVLKVDGDGILTVVAGTGGAGFGGDGGPARQALLHSPRSVCLDGEGRVYVADHWNHRVRRIDVNGVITTVAGTDTAGFSGDDGPAVQAELSGPEALEFDESGNLYIGDKNNLRVRRVDPAGVITTVAGGGSNGAGEDNSPATDAKLGLVEALAIDAAGNLFLAEANSNRVRLVTPDGGIVTVAGTGRPGYSGGGGPATDAELDWPAGLAVDGAGNLFIADNGNDRIRRMDTEGRIVTVAGNGSYRPDASNVPALEVALGGVHGIDVDEAGRVFLATVRLDSKLFRGRVHRLVAGGSEQVVQPNLASSPKVGSLIDLGTMVVDPDEPHGPLSRALLVGNEGQADLVVESVVLTGDPADFTMSLRTGRHLDLGGEPASLPHVIPNGTHDASLKVIIESNLAFQGRAAATLEITSNDPDTPVVTYEVRSAGSAPTPEGLENVFIGLFLHFLDAPPESPALRQSRGLLNPAVDIIGDQRLALEIDPAVPLRLVTQLPAFLGGETFELNSFTGSLEVSISEIPNDFTRMAITIDHGEFTAPSVTLPSGLETGLNTLTFGPAEQSGGVLDLETGEFTAGAAATIVNSLEPDGIRVRGSYSGTFDTETGRVQVTSQSSDHFEATAPLEILWLKDQLWLTWYAEGSLEQAASVTGPWTPIPDAISPHRVDPRASSRQYFRLR